MKKVLVILSVLAFCACSTVTESSNNETNTLVVYGLFDDSELYNELIEEYEKNKPETSIYYRKFIDPQEYKKLIQQEIQEGEGPDIFMTQNTWIEEFEEMLSLSQNYSSELAQVQLLNTITADLAREHGMLGLSPSLDTLALISNTELMPQPPQSWQSLKDMSASIAIGQINREEDFRAWLELQNLEPGIYEELSHFEGNEVQAFINGEIPAILGYSFTLRQILEQFDANKVQVTELPAFAPTESQLAHYYFWGVNKNSKSTEEAWDFLIFLNSDQSQKTIHSYSKRPSTSRTLNQIEAQDPLWGTFAKQAKNAQTI